MMHKNKRPRKHRFKICSAVVSTFVLFTCTMGGCTANDKAPIDPTAIVEPDHGLYENGVPFDEAPVIPELRSDEEIAATGLTHNDVLNAYDQLATEIAKAYYDHSPFGEVTQEIKDAIVAQFDRITPTSISNFDDNGNESTQTAPFFALNPEHCAFDGWNGPWGASDIVPAYGVTIHLTAYADGCRIATRIDTAGIEQSAFERTMEVFEQKRYLMDYDTYAAIREEVGNELFNHHGYLLRDFDKEVYEGLTITRETIANANAEQLEALYAMIPSLRSILLHHELPG